MIRSICLSFSQFCLCVCLSVCLSVCWITIPPVSLKLDVMCGLPVGGTD